MRQIVPFFKAVDPRRLSDPGEQLSNVLNFRRNLEEENRVFFHVFDELQSFEDKLRNHLAQWVRDHEGGQTAKVPRPTGPPKLPPAPSPISPKEVPPIGISSDLKQLLKEAWGLADLGQLTAAETKFAEALVRGSSVFALNEYSLFLMRIGRHQQAEVMLRRALELSVLSSDKEGEAIALGNLALICQHRGKPLGVAMKTLYAFMSSNMTAV